MSSQLLFLIPRVPITSFTFHNAWRGNASLCPCNTRLGPLNPTSSSDCGLGFRGRVPWSGSPDLVNGSQRASKGLWVVRAVSVPDNAGGGAEAEAEAAAAAASAGLIGTVQLVGMFGLWYLLNIYFNIFNKQILRVYPFPSTVTAFQFGCGSLMVLLMWGLNLHPRPKITRLQLATILPLAVAHAMGNLLTNVSLGKVAVSFTHTIKAMEPFFTVLLSAVFLGESPSLWVLSSLVPVVGGVALVSFTEASFNWLGFCSAMASNLTNQSRNVLSKKLMVNKEEAALDNINLFSVITLICFIMLVPAAILIDGVKFTPAYLQTAASQGVNVTELYMRALLCGLCFHTYQQVMIAGFIHDIRDGISSDAFSRELSEASCCHWVFSHLLPDTTFAPEFIRNCASSCRCLLVHKSKTVEARP